MYLSDRYNRDEERTMKKTVYYSDELKDDFSPSKDKIKTKTISSDFEYDKKNIFWKLIEFFIYRVIATPIVFCFCKIKYGMRFKNRSVLRKLKGSYFLYSNHTQTVADAFTPSLLTFPKKCKIVTSDDAVSIKGLKNLVLMLGAVPLPGSYMGTKNFLDSLQIFTSKGIPIMIYPEAHIWPYYNGVRPFTDSPFAYPVKLNLPVVGVTTVYRQRKIFKHKPPLITVIVSEPIYPDTTLSVRDSKKQLRDFVYDFMCKTVDKEKSYEHIRYIKRQPIVIDENETENDEYLRTA